MKSIYAGLFLIVACCFSVFATTLDSSDWFGFGGSLGTGGVWSSGSLVENPEALQNIKGFYRVILETDACVELRFQKNIVLAGGLYSLFDFKFKNGEHAHSIDYGFYSGLRIYPELKGFRFGVDYLIGRRNDFIDMVSIGKLQPATQWGNGFRFLLEYDFFYNNKGVSPVVAAAWRHVALGGFSDNALSVDLKSVYR